MDDNKMNRNLIQARLDKGYSKRFLEKKIGISKDRIDSLENHGISPSLDVAANIANVLESDIDDIFPVLRTDYSNHLLKKERIRQGYSIKGLSSILDMSSPALYSYENLRCFPDKDISEKIADALDVPVESIFPEKMKELYLDLKHEEEKQIDRLSKSLDESLLEKIKNSSDFSYYVDHLEKSYLVEFYMALALPEPCIDDVLTERQKKIMKYVNISKDFKTISKKMKLSYQVVTSEYNKGIKNIHSFKRNIEKTKKARDVLFSRLLGKDISDILEGLDHHIKKYVVSSLDVLSSNQKKAIDNIYFKGKNFRETAKLLGVARQNVYQLHDNALLRLRKHLISENMQGSFLDYVMSF